MHLILLQPGLVVMDEEVYGVALAEEGGAQGAILDVARGGPDHELLDGGPARVLAGTARLEPVLALAVFVGQRHQIVVLNMGTHCCITDLSQKHGYKFLPFPPKGEGEIFSKLKKREQFGGGL